MTKEGASPGALVLRARIVRTIRAFFDGLGFLEVETPLLVPSPGLDVHLDAFEIAAGPPGEGTRPRPRYLTTSPEYQMKRLLAAGHDKIYQLGKAFRKGEVGERHNPEFTMLEWYRAHAGMEAVMHDTEALVRLVSGGAIELRGRTVDTGSPFERMTVREAFERFASTGEDEMLRLASGDADEETEFYRRMVERVEPALSTFDVPVFLTDYPASQASLARRKPGDPRYAGRFELYAAGVELCNGFDELTDSAEQRTRFERDQAARVTRGLPVYPIDERFLEALPGMPPSGGNALGVDRLVALCMGTQAIGDVIAFPWAAL